MILQLTHRVARIPGVKESLAAKKNWQVIELERGRGAIGAIQFWDQSSNQLVGRGVPFLTSRPLPTTGQPPHDPQRVYAEEKPRPTHLLYQNLAYPISEQPQFVGQEPAADDSEIVIRGQSAGVSLKYCSVQLSGHDVVLTDLSSDGTFVDGARVTGTSVLLLGQTIRVGTSRETLQLIACRDAYEGQKSNDI